MDYKEFLRVLENRKEGRPVVFEPFMPKAFIEQIVWRTGEHVWDTPYATTATLIACNKHIKLDTTFIDARNYSTSDMDAVLSAASELLPISMRLVVFCNSEDILVQAQSNDLVCAISLCDSSYAHLLNKPAIYMHDISISTLENAIKSAIYNDFNAIHIPTNIGQDIPCIQNLYDIYSDHIAILGGVGIDFFNNNKPLPIYNKCKSLFAHTKNKGYAIGTGNSGETISYLGLISMFGVYQSSI